MNPGQGDAAVGTPGVELRHLRALVALTEEGTFTGAARRLGISQPAVSRSITALEEVLATRLVDRTTRAVALTDVGVRCYRSAVTALAAVEEVVTATSGRNRPLRLGYAWSALGRHTGAVLRRWRSERPDVPIEVHRVDDMDGGLGRGTADVTIVRGSLERSDCVTQVVFREPRVAALPVWHPLARQESVLLGDLRDETVLTSPYGITRLDLWPEHERPQRTLQLQNTDEWITEVAGGLGVGVTAESTAALYAHPDVVFVPVDDAEWLPVHLVWQPVRAHPATADFVELVSAVARER